MVSLDFVKTVYDLLLKANQIELAQKIQELREELLNSRESMIDLRQKVLQLEEAISFKSKLIFERGVYWILEDEMKNPPAKTPICPACWEYDGTPVRLTVKEGTRITSAFSNTPGKNYLFVRCLKGHYMELE